MDWSGSVCRSLLIVVASFSFMSRRDGDDESGQPVGLGFFRGVTGVVTGLETTGVGHCPYLQQLHGLSWVLVVLAVSDSGTGRSHLNVPAFESLGVMQRVSMGEFSLEDCFKSRNRWSIHRSLNQTLGHSL